MPARNRRRFADALLNSQAGDHAQALPLAATFAHANEYSVVNDDVTFTFYKTTNTTFGPIYGPGGNVWFAAGGSVGSFNVADKTITQCPQTSGLAQEIVADGEGNVWFGVSWGPNVIGSSNGSCSVQTHATAGWTNDLALGSDGNIYFSDRGQKIGRATPSGTITEFATTFGTNDPYVGPDGSIWFGESGPKVGRLAIATGQVTEWTVKAAATSGSLIYGPDGSIWFGTDLVIGRITPQGDVQQFDIDNAGAFNLLVGPDGNIWFACQFSAQVGKVTMSGEVSLYNINDNPMGMVFGVDNKLYVGQLSYFLAVVDLLGNVTEVTLTGAVPYAPYLGPDGNVWFPGNPWLSPGVSPFIGRITPAGVLTEFPQSAYPNSFLNSTDGKSMYMGMGTYLFGVVNFS